MTMLVLALALALCLHRVTCLVQSDGQQYRQVPQSIAVESSQRSGSRGLAQWQRYDTIASSAGAGGDWIRWLALHNGRHEQAASIHNRQTRQCTSKQREIRLFFLAEREEEWRWLRDAIRITQTAWRHDIPALPHRRAYIGMAHGINIIPCPPVHVCLSAAE
ncbi:hypothetical protein J3F83DRAFT_289321 [Trichoderma novae-zelandiae]